MKFRKKMEDPIIIDLQHQVVLKQSEDDTEISLDPGAINARSNYGFILLVPDKHGRLVQHNYPTEERISAFGIVDDTLVIFEEGKYFSWNFTFEGICLREAIFSSSIATDCQYVANKYGVLLDDENSLKLK